VDRRSYWNKISGHYDTLYSSRWSAREDRLTARILTRELHSATGVRILDVGCGSGLGFRLLDSSFRFMHYSGIDFAESMISELKSRHPHVVAHCGEALEVMKSLESEKFDFILSINATMSFPQETDLILQQVSRLLVPGGRFCLSFLNQRSLRRRLGRIDASIEEYRTRGDQLSTGWVPALAVDEVDFRQQLLRAGLHCQSVDYLSVLGGVWESGLSVVPEIFVQILSPKLGHLVYFSGAKK
jgi:ubiquinone/menaquinone biosynthesis C-methylase UbiE